VIEATQKKLGEAKFFLRHLETEAKKPNSDREVFRYYLSAFLSASRSITWFLQKENKPLYDSSYQAWKQRLEERDGKLLEDMNQQRVAEVHKGGVELQSQVQSVPFFDVDRGSNTDPRYGVHFFGLMGMTGGSVQVEIVERYFDLSQGPEEVTATCRRYLGLLENFVNEFE